MLNKLLAFIRRYDMLHSGEHVVCAVSGGADSVALLFAMYLLADKLGISVSAAHYNHHLRGAESDRDEAFVRQLCDRYNIALHLGGSHVAAGRKGLEAAARDARYGFLKSIPGKIATAHTADDNAETVLMRLVRGTGLKGLGAIPPVSGALIRPMLGITRADVLAFLDEYNLCYITDSSNDSDGFLRNRLRHHVMPLLKEENPAIAENLSAMALRLQTDEAYLDAQAQREMTVDVRKLRAMPTALRCRVLCMLLRQWNVKEPEAEHIALLEGVVFSDNPSACANFPNGVCVARQYMHLTLMREVDPLPTLKLSCPGFVELPQIGLRVCCRKAKTLINEGKCFAVCPEGDIFVRCRHSGDRMRLSGGSKSLKEIFIDRKIPASQRLIVPVIADGSGILGVYGIGADVTRLSDGDIGMEIYFEKM